jgi:hypothetical protein
MMRMWNVGKGGYGAMQGYVCRYVSFWYVGCQIVCPWGGASASNTSMMDMVPRGDGEQTTRNTTNGRAPAGGRYRRPRSEARENELLEQYSK